MDPDKRILMISYRGMAAMLRVYNCLEIQTYKSVLGQFLMFLDPSESSWLLGFRALLPYLIM